MLICQRKCYFKFLLFGVLSKCLASLMRNNFPKPLLYAPLHTLLKLYYSVLLQKPLHQQKWQKCKMTTQTTPQNFGCVLIGYVNVPPHPLWDSFSAEEWLIHNIGLFVLFLGTIWTINWKQTLSDLLFISRYVYFQMCMHLEVHFDLNYSRYNIILNVIYCSHGTLYSTRDILT